MTGSVVCATAVCFSRYRSTGKERDTESGNDYFGARYYASSMGRFMSPDPSQLMYANPANPQGFNLYGYVLNNPLVFTDPTGLRLQLSCYNDQDTYSTSTDANGNATTTVTAGAQHCSSWEDGQGLPSGNIPYKPSPPPVKLPVHSPRCGSSGLLPHSMGLSVGGNADLGWLFQGVTATASAGAGGFYDSATGGSAGAYASGGVAAYFFNGQTGAPAQQGQVGSLGSYAGYGPSGWISNASSVQELGGPFTTVNLNVGAGPVQVGSLQLSYGGGIWQLSYGPPVPLPFGAGTPSASLSKLTTTTAPTKTGCEQW